MVKVTIENSENGSTKQTEGKYVIALIGAEKDHHHTAVVGTIDMLRAVSELNDMAEDIANMLGEQSGDPRVGTGFLLTFETLIKSNIVKRIEKEKEETNGKTH